MWPRALEVAIRRRTLDSILVAEIATGHGKSDLCLGISERIVLRIVPKKACHITACFRKIVPKIPQGKTACKLSAKSS